MSVDPSDVQAGRCFVTSTNQVRRVVEVTADGRVNYQARGASYSLGEKSWGIGAPLSNLPTVQKFAEEVDRAVTVDWDPNYPERRP